MTDLKSRTSSRTQPAERFRWRKVIGWALLSAALIGGWVFNLLSVAVSEMTRGEVVLYRPTGTGIVVSTFLMLLGAVLLSVQLVAVVNYLMHGHAPPEH